MLYSLVLLLKKFREHIIQSNMPETFLLIIVHAFVLQLQIIQIIQMPNGARTSTFTSNTQRGPGQHPSCDVYAPPRHQSCLRDSYDLHTNRTRGVQSFCDISRAEWNTHHEPAATVGGPKRDSRGKFRRLRPSVVNAASTIWRELSGRGMQRMIAWFLHHLNVVL
jgi:hypothetical protein